MKKRQMRDPLTYLFLIVLSIFLYGRRPYMPSLPGEGVSEAWERSREIILVKFVPELPEPEQAVGRYEGRWRDFLLPAY